MPSIKPEERVNREGDANRRIFGIEQRLGPTLTLIATIGGLALFEVPEMIFDVVPDEFGEPMKYLAATFGTALSGFLLTGVLLGVHSVANGWMEDAAGDGESARSQRRRSKRRR